MTQVEDLMRAAADAARDESTSATERAQMLMELAMGLQRRPKTRRHLTSALELYEQALALSTTDPLLAARITARRATALQALPDGGDAAIEEARQAFVEVLPTLQRLGNPPEVAEAEMNLGLCLQHLGRIRDAIAAYQRALRTFDAQRYPVEFALLQNNLATAFLSMPENKISEALAVQCFEQALKTVNLIDHPAEYAMLQNNLGNALQSIASGHVAENHVRALAAYDEALKVRTRAARPVERANTLANKANCLWSLGEVDQAKACYREAQELFAAHGEIEKARLVAEALGEG